MAMAGIHRTIITAANEMGYFPTQRQAREINCLWAHRALMSGDTTCTDALMRQAITDLMERRITDPIERTLLKMK